MEDVKWQMEALPLLHFPSSILHKNKHFVIKIVYFIVKIYGQPYFSG